MPVHIDDMIVAGMTMDCDGLSEYLNTLFFVNDLGDLKHDVGSTLEWDRTSGTMTKAQLACVERLLVTLDIKASSPIPDCPTVEFRPCEVGEEETSEPFHEAVGGLMWVKKICRSGIANAVTEVARHSHDSPKKDWTAAVKMLTYLTTKDPGLRYTRIADPTLSA